MNRLNVIALEILEGCNLYCPFCIRNAHHNLTNKVSISNYEKFLNMLLEFPDRPDVALTGGEPFLQKGLQHIIEKTVDYGFRFSITTNATVKSESVISMCKETDLFKHFIISLDSYKPDVHDSIRGKNAFTRTMSFIDYIRKESIPFCINMTINEMNFSDVDGTIKFANEIGAKDISVATVKPNGRGEATLGLDKLNSIYKQVIDNKSLINDHFKVWGTDVTLFLYDIETYREVIEDGEKGSCSFGDSSLHVKANGDVLGCTACEDIVLGNIFRNENTTYLTELWNNSKVLNQVRAKEHLDGLCGECEFTKFCGGCRCRSYGVHGDLFGDDPYCPIVIQDKGQVISQ